MWSPVEEDMPDEQRLAKTGMAACVKSAVSQVKQRYDDATGACMDPSNRLQTCRFSASSTSGGNKFGDISDIFPTLSPSQPLMRFLAIPVRPL